MLLYIAVVVTLILVLLLFASVQDLLWLVCPKLMTKSKVNEQVCMYEVDQQVRDWKQANGYKDRKRKITLADE